MREDRSFIIQAVQGGAVENSLAHLPVDRVIRVAGPTDEQLTVALDPLPDGAPVVLRYLGVRPASSSHVVVDDALARLEAVAVNSYPAWLPSATELGVGSDFDLRVVRELAHRHAAATSHFGPLLADVAAAALRGGTPDRTLSSDLRATGLARMVAEGYGRDGVVLLVGPTAISATEPEQQRMAVAFEWLADHGIGVWLTAGALPDVDRHPTVRVPVPAHVLALDTATSTAASITDPPTIDYPALAGRPHPASPAEQTLERCLGRCEWAAGRAWNQVYASHTLAPPIRVDLMWPAERCVVEIDGPDHRGSLKYAADRRRDNGLTLDGFAVLRFTNDEILDDPMRVLNVIASLLSKKRHDEGKPR